MQSPLMVEYGQWTQHNLKPIFRQKSRLHWVTSANKIDTNNTKSTWPTRAPILGGLNHIQPAPVVGHVGSTGLDIGTTMQAFWMTTCWHWLVLECRAMHWGCKPICQGCRPICQGCRAMHWGVEQCIGV